MLNIIIGALLIGDALAGITVAAGKVAGMLGDIERDRLGYKPGEGILTPSVKVKVELSETPDKNPIGHTVALAATVYQVLERYVGKTYIMTVSEEQQAKVMAGVLGGALMAGMRQQKLGHMEPAADTYQIGKQAAEALDVFFGQFPEGRTN